MMIHVEMRGKGEEEGRKENMKVAGEEKMKVAGEEKKSSKEKMKGEEPLPELAVVERAGARGGVLVRSDSGAAACSLLADLGVLGVPGVTELPVRVCPSYFG